MTVNEVVESCVFELRKMKERADRAIRQVASEDLYRKPDAESNSIAELMKHVGGNLTSRWTDFLSTDGEKSGRNRDEEFLSSESDTPEKLWQRWESGWATLHAALGKLRPEDIDRTVTIRGEAHSVIQAIHRTVAHSANHVGQIIYLAKHFAGPRWKTLTVPRGQSEQFTSAMKAGGGYLSQS
jgi:uncharacterized protein DUF1572